MTIPIKVDVEIDRKGFEASLRAAFARELAALTGRVAPRLLPAVQEVVESSVRNSPEYASLLGGRLRELFGLADPGPVLAAVGAALRAGVKVSPTPSGIAVAYLGEGLGPLLNVEGASYVSHSLARHTDILIPWLSWLLLEGDRLIIAEWEVNTAKPRPRSRTGSAIMVRPTRRPPRGFRVPAEFSGVASANWITRCLESAQPAVASLLASAVRRG